MISTLTSIPSGSATDEENMMHEFHDAVSDVKSIGPFHYWPATVHGWTVPHLEVKVRANGDVTLTLDRRTEIDLPPEVAGRTIAFVADCIAVSKGYACHPRADGWGREPSDLPTPPLWPWRHMVGLMPEEADSLGVQDD